LRKQSPGGGPDTVKCASAPASLMRRMSATYEWHPDGIKVSLTWWAFAEGSSSQSPTDLTASPQLAKVLNPAAAQRGPRNKTHREEVGCGGRPSARPGSPYDFDGFPARPAPSAGSLRIEGGSTTHPPLAIG
jgi:hypothetical protein